MLQSCHSHELLIIRYPCLKAGCSWHGDRILRGFSRQRMQRLAGDRRALLALMQKERKSNENSTRATTSYKLNKLLPRNCNGKKSGIDNVRVFF